MTQEQNREQICETFYADGSYQFESEINSYLKTGWFVVSMAGFPDATEQSRTYMVVIFERIKPTTNANRTE